MFAALSCLGDPFNCALAAIQLEWWWGGAGLVLGYLWGRFGLLGLIVGLATGAYALGRFRRPGNSNEKPHTDKPKRRGLFSRFRQK
jgi:hypothetical protein